MIVIVNDRSTVAEAYRAALSRKGVSVSDFCSNDYAGWIAAATEDDVKAIDAVPMGECEGLSGATGIIERRCGSVVTAMNERTSIEATPEPSAEGAGDDDAEPCRVREIMPRIEAVSRRARGGGNHDELESEIRTFRDSRYPVVRGEPLRLPRRELRILEHPASSRSRRVTKAQIFDSVFGLSDQDIIETVIESYLCRLRRRLCQRLGCSPITSKRHLGYRLVQRPGDPGEWCKRAVGPLAIAVECREDMS